MNAAFIGPGMALARARFASGRNRFLLTRRRHPVRVAAQFVVLAPAIVALTGALAYANSRSFETVAQPREQAAMLAAFFALFAIGGFIGVSTAALHALYLSEDVPFMMALPVPLGVTFASKMAGAATGAIPASILGVSAIAGLAITESPTPAFLIAAMLGFLSLLALTTAASVTFVSFITRYVPPKRARAYLLLTAFALIGLSAATWPLAAAHRNPSGSESVGLDFARSVISRTPAGWTARAIQAAASGSTSEALIWLGLATGAAALFCLGSYDVFKRVYLGSLDRAADIQIPSGARPSHSPILTTLARPIPEPLRAIALKEWLTLARDMRRLSGIVWPALIVLFYTVILGKRSGATRFDPELRFWLGNGSLVLLPWGISLGVSIYAFGSEGRAISLIRSLPMSARQIFLSKVLASLIPIALISIALTAVTLFIRGAGIADSLQMLVLVLWMAAGYVIIDTAASAVAPNFEILQIQRAIGLPGRAFGLVAGGGFGLATALGVARIVSMAHGTPESFRSTLDAGSPATNPFGWPLAIASFGIAIAVVALTTIIGVRRVEAILREG